MEFCNLNISLHFECSAAPSLFPGPGQCPSYPSRWPGPETQEQGGEMVKGLRSKQIKLPSGCQSPLINISLVHNVHCSCLTFGPELNV